MAQADSVNAAISAEVARRRVELYERLTAYAAEYSANVWPDCDYTAPTDDDLWFMEYRADGYSNQHNTQDTEYHVCGYSTSTECGERAAAAEYVETH